MRALSLLIVLFFAQSAVWGQNTKSSLQADDGFPTKIKGQAYFKVSPSSDIDLPSYDREADSKDVYDGMPWIQDLLEPYEIQRIHCPFRTQDPRVQHIYRIEFDATSAEKTQEMLERLRKKEFVNYAQQGIRHRSFYDPNDIHTKQEWYLDSIKAPAAWNMSKGDSNTTIAIVDDAVHISHPDLQGNIKYNNDEVPGNGNDDDGNGYVDDIQGYDVADQDNDPRPPDNHSWYGNGQPVFTHGTHTSGIASAVTDNNTGVAGTGFNSSIIPIKATSNSSIFPLGIQNPAEGVDYAIQAHADILSMSLGSQSQDCTLTNMLQSAHNDSIFLIAAAGNDPSWDTAWPAAQEEVFAVGATTYKDSVWDESTYGTWVDIMAPGTEIQSTLWIGDSQTLTYDTLSGTSMACPMVAGVAALLKSHRWWAEPHELENCLKSGAKNIDAINPSYVDSMGAGRLDAHASLQCLEATVSLRENGSGNASELSVYPNPSPGTFRWNNSSEKEFVRLDVKDMTGRTVRSIDIDPSKDQGRADLSDLSKNIYFLRFMTQEGDALTKKLSLIR